MTERLPSSMTVSGVPMI